MPRALQNPYRNGMSYLGHPPLSPGLCMWVDLNSPWKFAKRTSSPFPTPSEILPPPQSTLKCVNFTVGKNGFYHYAFWVKKKNFCLHDPTPSPGLCMWVDLDFPWKFGKGKYGDLRIPKPSGQSPQRDTKFGQLWDSAKRTLPLCVSGHGG